MTDTAQFDSSLPPLASPRRKLIDLLSQDVTPQVDAAARRMIAGGDALLVKNSRSAVHGFVLDQDHFDTKVEWTGSDFNAICSCETRAAGFVCPHLWATVLLADRSGAFRALEEAHTHPIFHRNGDATPARRSPSAWPSRPGWKIHLAAVAQAAAQHAADLSSATPGLPRQVLYIVDVAETQSGAAATASPAALSPGGGDGGGGEAIIIELQSRHLKKPRTRPANGGGASGGNGGWTKGAPFRLDVTEIDTFSDPVDRDILARIVGARPEDSPTPDSAHTPAKFFVLRGSVGIELLRRMCDTGRCRIRLSSNALDTAQLLWDDGLPYQFLLRIAPHDDGKHYTLTGHLRRGEITLPLSAATLLAEPAPGTEHPGLVFIDNRVAYGDLAGGLQWMGLLSARGPLHVPKSDAHEFLRQIAALPAIPHFDLPEELQFDRLTGTPRPRLVLKKPTRISYAAKPDDRIIGSVLFDYDAGPIDALATAAGSYDPASRKMILRDKPAEARALAVLKSVGFRQLPDPDTQEMQYELSSRHLPGVVPVLIREGWIVEAEGKLYRAATDFRVSVSSGIDWFDVSGSVQFGEQVVPIPRLLAAARKGEHLIKLSDGTFGVLPEEWLAKYGVIVQSGQSVKTDDGAEAIRFSKAQASMLDVLLESQPHASVDASFQNLRDQLHNFTGIAPLQAPPTFVGTLRPYQEDGLGWFDFLRQFNFGGCLADDMGLGKTIQVLALLASRRSPEFSVLSPESRRSNENSELRTPSELRTQNSELRRPSLVVAPRSLIFNWREEAARFSPTLRILDHTGPSRIRSAEKFPDYDVILTTYGTLRSDILFLKDFRFDYAILDEAQAIKNAQTESAKAARLLQADHRLTLSGTPVQNHLGELWSLFEFLNPGMLGAAAVFDARFHPAKPKSAPAEEPVVADLAPSADAGNDSPDSALSTQNSELVGDSELAAADSELRAENSELGGPDSDEESPRQILSRALRPFILRRTKEQVARDLPPCTEQTIYCELDESQRALYDELRDHYRQTLLGTAPNSELRTQNSALRANRMQVLEALLRLRQAACHPGLIDKTRVGEPSSKLDTLLTQLDEILDEGHKALVFSQFTSLLAIVRKRLDDRNQSGADALVGPPSGPSVRYAYLDGKTRDRKSPVEQFQNDPATRLFLISLKAGGLGLNLTSADYVFLLDPWWNPAVEAQAIDRAHRIGQFRHVFAYRLIAKGTVEEKVLQLQQTKRDLADAIISEDNALLSTLTSDDLQVLLS